MFKRRICLLMALCLAFLALAAAAEPTEINGKKKRKITIHPAGINEVMDGISPTTGRDLVMLKDWVPEKSAGLAVTGRYMPIMVQITNGKSGVGSMAPLYGACADIVYETPLNMDGISRISMIFSDVIPPYAGFIRSTRLAHLRIRQEWDCAYLTSGYSTVDIHPEMEKLGILRPDSKRITKSNPGLIYVTDYRSRPWGKYSRRTIGKGTPAAPNNMAAELAALVTDVVPADYVPKNHAFLFTDEKPEGDDAAVVYVKVSSDTETWSQLEYDAETNVYTRYMTGSGEKIPYAEAIPRNLVKTTVNGQSRYRVKGLDTGENITFSNVIIQYAKLKWLNKERPDPKLTGTGNADYFMGGKHIAGVWARDDLNDRTVFYDQDGNEIQLQRGRTLIIMPDWQRSGSVSYE